MKKPFPGGRTFLDVVVTDSNPVPSLHTRDSSVQEEHRSKERLLIILICCAAALRVFLFSAAFPFFNNVDEEAHMDTVRKFAAGHVPRSLEHFDKESVNFIVTLRSPEYAQGIPAGDAFNQAVSNRGYWDMTLNHESTSPPIYYAVAALWYKIGTLLKLQGRALLYWLRFLNVPLFMLLVLCAYIFARTVFPVSWHMRLGLPVIVTFWPQDAFYGISDDALSAPLVVLALLFLLRIYRIPPGRHTSLCVVTGLLIAAAYLTKVTNVPIVLVALLVIAANFARRGCLMDRLHQTCVLCCAALIPVAAWCIRQYLLLGDVTGNAAKMRALGWSIQTLGAIRKHPIFTPHGAVTFGQGLMGTFWRGEFFWHGTRLSMPSMDMFYTTATVVLLGIGACRVFFPRPSDDPELRTAITISLISFVFFVGMLVWLSIAFDFGNCAYPSRQYPYFTSGRLISGAFVPVIALFVLGLDSIFPNRRVCFAVIIAISFAITISELYLSWAVFRSPYNWFHT